MLIYVVDKFQNREIHRETDVKKDVEAMASRHFSLRTFLRTVSNDLLAEYFQRIERLSDVEFEKLSSWDIEPIFKAIQKLPKKIRDQVELDFQDSFALAYEGGIKLLLDIAAAQGLELKEELHRLEGNSAKAFWVFLSHKELLDTALPLSARDNLTGHWRKCYEFPITLDADFEEKKIPFSTTLAQYFWNKHGHGKHCTVDYYRHRNLHCFHAHPEGTSRIFLHYVNKRLVRGHHKPAYEVIFMYDANAGALDVYYEGELSTVKDLQEVFAQIVLGMERIVPPQKPTYDLEPLKYRQFQFKYPTDSGIQGVQIMEMGLSRPTSAKERKQVILKEGAQSNPLSIYDSLDLYFPTASPDKRPSRSMAFAYYARIKVSFYPLPGNKRPKSRIFSITHPNSCGLKYDKRDLIRGYST